MSDWRKVLLSPVESISRAIEILDIEAQRIVLIVGEENRLLGTVTDGDIRRGLLGHVSMDASVSEIMNKTPKVASADDSKETIMSIIKTYDLLQVPLLDSSGSVVGMETLQHLISLKKYDNPVFLMAGGFGKRLHPLTIDTPKPLLKVGDKPILQSILESFINQGFHNFYISTHYKAEMVRDHFGNGDTWGVSINYVHEDKPLGTAGAIALLPEDISELPLIMMNGDLLTRINFEQLLQYHSESGGVTTMCVREYDFQVPYGVVTARDNCVEKILEKPVHKFFVNAGIYVLSSKLCQSVNEDVYLDMPDLLQNRIVEGDQVNMFPVHEYWLDIGRMEDFEKAQEVIGE